MSRYIPAMLVVATVAFASPIGGAQPPGTRTVYVAAVDGKDAPVADLTAADFAVKEDGKPREIVSAEIAKTPMQVVLMLDDSGLALGAIRQGAGQFIEALQGKAEFAIVTMGGRNLTYVDFTKDPPTLYAALQKLFARNSPPTYILDGFLEAAETLIKRKAERAVIVAVATEGEELSNARAEVVLDAIQKSGAKLYWIGLGAPATQGTRPAYSADRPNDSTENESAKRNAVLGAAPRNSGGRSEQALQSSGVPVMMKQFAAELASQYAVTYRTEVSEAKLSVEMKRKGVKLRAPARVGSK